MLSEQIIQKMRCPNNDCMWSKLAIPMPVGSICALCHSEMIPVEDINWLKNISDDNNGWIENADKNWPSVLAFEYNRLRSLCSEKNSYGVMLCLKDNFEALLKFEILIAFAWLKNRCDEKFEREVLSQITAPNLSFGSWRALARIIVEGSKRFNYILPEYIPLEKVWLLFSNSKMDIVNWRNEKIGHGVLGFEEDELFKKDITEKIGWFRSIAGELDAYLQKQNLYLRCNDGSIEELLGAEKARNLPNGGKVYVKIAGESIDEIELDPFICVWCDDEGQCGEEKRYGIYFFDNQKKPSLSFFQAYTTGYSHKLRESYFEKLRSYIEKKQVTLDAAADNPYKETEEYRLLDIASVVDDYVRYDGLFEWLKDKINEGEYKKGSFLIKMDRGMGKSVFTDKLSTLFDNPEYIADDLDVRTYHFSRMQSGGEEDLYTYIEMLWNHAYGGKEYNGIRPIKEHLSEEENKRKGFAEYLGDVLKSRLSKGNHRRILMVLDGVDEIVNQKELDFLPAGEDLPDGVYILYTSRNPDTESLKYETEKSIKEMIVDDELIVTKESSTNIDFLKKYISNGKMSSVDENVKETIIEKAGYNILQLSLLCRLVENGVGIDEIDDPKKLVSAYLNLLRKRYGNKEYTKIEELLAIIAVLGEIESLSLRTIGELSSENMVTLRLIGLMADILPLLNVERGESGNYYRIVNTDVCNEVLQMIIDMNSIVRGLVMYANASLVYGEPGETKGDDAVCRHMTELAILLPEGTEAIKESDRKALMNSSYVFQKNLLIKSEYLFGKIEETLERWQEEHYIDDASYLEAFNMLIRVYKLAMIFSRARGNTLLGRKIMSKKIECFKRIKESCSLFLGDENERTISSSFALLYSYYEGGYNAEVLEEAEWLKNNIGTNSESEMLLLAISYMRNNELISSDAVGNASTWSDAQFKDMDFLLDYLIVNKRKYEAVIVSEVIFKIRRLLFGDKDLNTIKSVEKLAMMNHIIGHNSDAVDINRNAFELKKATLGSNHKETIMCMRMHMQYAKDPESSEKSIFSYKSYITNDVEMKNYQMATEM